ncbi:hypothetical protein [Amycolatopsis cihanbeyliensis]|uniref:Uncharacterized protein n=1 Tax=Amycolatopsis cihanbeyliensis TaxID=1128664 RepID=A0A542DKY3_AMYCI|nr:hypothetical protein [Amycolatopsis cihanbeyliensis]TQJ03761.1 hypothetical protein FB471_3529 [Amycolatopsis cihanbeyliensis]
MRTRLVLSGFAAVLGLGVGIPLVAGADTAPDEQPAARNPVEATPAQEPVVSTPPVTPSQEPTVAPSPPAVTPSQEPTVAPNSPAVTPSPVSQPPQAPRPEAQVPVDIPAGGHP